MAPQESDPAPDAPITPQQIDGLLPFFEIFDQPGFDFGGWHSPHGQLPFCELSELATNFGAVFRFSGRCVFGVSVSAGAALPEPSIASLVPVAVRLVGDEFR